MPNKMLTALGMFILSSCSGGTELSEVQIVYPNFFYSIPTVNLELNRKSALIVLDTGAESLILQSSFIDENPQSYELSTEEIDFDDGIVKKLRAFSDVEIHLTDEDSSPHVAFGYVDSLAIFENLGIDGVINPAKLSVKQCTVIDFNLSIVQFYDDHEQCAGDERHSIKLSDQYLSSIEINGKNAERVLFDTGTPMTFISDKFEKQNASKLGYVRVHTYNGIEVLDVMDGAEFRIGENLILVEEIAIARHKLPRGLDAIIGMDLLKKSTIRIDKLTGISLSMMTP